MSEYFAALEHRLCEQFAAEARGPKRNGLFALWLVMRVAGDTLPPHAVTERAHRRRSEALVKRLASLTLPGPLRTPLHDAASALGERSTTDVRHLMSELVPTVRQTLGSQAANVVAAAAHRAPPSGLRPKQ